MSLKSTISGFLKKCLPLRYYKLIANGCIVVPAYYRNIIREEEACMNLAAENSLEKDLLLLRKYAHIIDKGLHRKDVTPGHSKSIYNALCETASRLKDSKYAGDPTYLWALDKIKAYEHLQESSGSFTPLEASAPTPSVSYEELFSLIRQRRSNRDFKQLNVEDSTIEQLIDTANWASSSCNKQPIEIFYTTNPDKATQCLRCCKGGTGFSRFVPAFVVFTANIRGYVYPGEMSLPYVDTSLGAQNFFLAATTLGLSGTILSWAQKNRQEEEDLRRLLDIPSDCKIIFCAAIGYANTQFCTPARKR